jgi:phosphate transport system substrate-binding protein
MKTLFLSCLTLTLLLGEMLNSAEARDKIRIVGSSTALPFTQLVAERFARLSGYPAPSLELTGAGIGFQTFCAGLGFEYPDITVTPRKITATELENCRQNGLTSVTEIEIGREVIVLVNWIGAKRYNFTRSQLFAALADKVQVNGDLVANPYKKWNSIAASLPPHAIHLMGPSPASTVYDAFLELIMDVGCQFSMDLTALDDISRLAVCQTLRHDDYFIPGARDEQFIIQWLRNNPHAFGIASITLLLENQNSLASNAIDGVFPTLENVSKGIYPLSRSLFLYVKNRHVEAIPGMQQFLYEFTSEHAISPAGYLVEKGFVPLDEGGRNRARDSALSLAPLRQ